MGLTAASPTEILEAVERDRTHFILPWSMLLLVAVMRRLPAGHYHRFAILEGRDAIGSHKGQDSMRALTVQI